MRYQLLVNAVLLVINTAAAELPKDDFASDHAVDAKASLNSVEQSFEPVTTTQSLVSSSQNSIIITTHNEPASTVSSYISSGIISSTKTDESHIEHDPEKGLKSFSDEQEIQEQKVLKDSKNETAEESQHQKETLFNESTEADIVLPEPLTTNNYDETLAKGLHIVEFYSPYCTHCKSLAPIWEDTYKTFYNEGKSLNVEFSRVNCVESGDICDRERIQRYPNIRLYGPAGYIKSFGDNERITKNGLLEFARSEAKVAENYKERSAGKPSKHVTEGELTSLVNDNANIKAYLVSLWPSSNVKTMKETANFSFCRDCSAFQKVWDDVSSMVSGDKIETVHLNCEKAPMLCEAFGYAELSNSKPENGLSRDPGVVFIIPNRQIQRNWEYDEPISFDPKNYVSWAEHLLHNSETPTFDNNKILEITSMDPAEFVTVKTEQPRLHVIYIPNDDSGVFNANQELYSGIFRLSTQLNLFLYKADAFFLDALDDATETMTDIINYNVTESWKKLNKTYLSLLKLTSKPTFVILKDGDSKIYVHQHSFVDQQETDVAQFRMFFRDAHMPVLKQLEPETAEVVLNQLGENINNFVIQFVDSTKPEETHKQLFDVLTATYDYEFFRQQYVVEGLKTEDKTFDTTMDLLKKGVPAGKYGSFHATQQKFINMDNRKTQLFYIDISKHKRLLSQFGLSKSFKAGETVIISRSKKQVYIKDIFGGTLLSEYPFKVRETLISLNFPEYTQYTKKVSGVPVELLSNKASISHELKMLFISVPIVLIALLFLRQLRKYWINRMAQKNSIQSRIKRDLAE